MEQGDFVVWVFFLCVFFCCCFFLATASADNKDAVGKTEENYNTK